MPDSLTVRDRTAALMAINIRKLIGWSGVAIAAPFFGWFLVGFIEGIPSMLDVFGERGLRTPAAVTIFGLLIAAVGFHEF